MHFRQPDSMSCRRLTPCLRLGRPHYIVPCIPWGEEKMVIDKCVFQIFLSCLYFLDFCILWRRAKKSEKIVSHWNSSFCVLWRVKKNSEYNNDKYLRRKYGLSLEKYLRKILENKWTTKWRTLFDFFSLQLCFSQKKINLQGSKLRVMLKIWYLKFFIITLLSWVYLSSHNIY